MRGKNSFRKWANLNGFSVKCAELSFGAATESRKSRRRKGPFGTLSHSLQLVTERAVIATLEATFLALPLARFDQMLETTRPLHGGFAALSASFISLHPELILPLP